jgi:DNA-binding transcriptional ArsR family regulator
MVTYSHDVDDDLDGAVDDDQVFRALADPTRRAVLDALFAEDGRSLTELAELFPAMTRFGVMKHLRVLEAASLVTTTKAGRVRHHYLNHVPIHAIAGRWLHKYALPITTAMLGLQRDLGVERDARPFTADERTHR